MSDRDPVQYVLVRKDLPPDVQMVMVGHATAEAVRVAPIDRRTVLRLLHVADEAELVLYQGKLAAKGIHHWRLVGETHDAHLVIRVRPGEGEDGTCAATLLASCTTLEAAESAYRLMSGESVYPLWRERQEWAR